MSEYLKLTDLPIFVNKSMNSKHKEVFKIIADSFFVFFRRYNMFTTKKKEGGIK